MSDEAMAIVFKRNALWYFQEQGVSGRRTFGGYASKEAAISMAAQKLGATVRLEVLDA